MAESRRQNGYLLYPSHRIDSSYAPIYITRTRSTGPDVMEDEFTVGRSWWPQLDHKVAWITEARERSDLTPERRAAYTSYLSDVQPFQDKFLVCSAVVIANEGQRGAAIAIRWQTKQSYPQEYLRI